MSETLKNYNRWSKVYDVYDNPMVAATSWAMDKAPLNWAGFDVLELGCGTGRNIDRVIESGARSYVGIDGASAMLAQAKSRCADSRIRLVQAELERELPVDNATFDSVLIVLVVEHIQYLEFLFREVSRVLKPGGLLRMVEIHRCLLASGTCAHFTDGEGEVRFESVAHSLQAIFDALSRAKLGCEMSREIVAAGQLLKRVPKLAKHLGKPIVLDIEARRTAV